MTPKQKIVKEYLENNVNFSKLQQRKNESWLKNKHRSWLYNNGIAFTEFYEYEKKAIILAGYKYPNSDRTWTTVQGIREKLILEKII